jgi:hypothetical protein
MILNKIANACKVYYESRYQNLSRTYMMQVRHISIYQALINVSS